MDLKVLGTVFSSVFLAELGDKTQLATMIFAADRDVSKWTVFAGSALALVTTSALGVVAGSILSRWVQPRNLEITAGIAFITLGAWTLWKALKG